MTLNLDDLATLAKAATPGPWTAEDDGDAQLEKPRYPGHGATSVYANEDCEWHVVADCSCNHTCRDDEQQQINAAFIAMLDPQTVLALIDELLDLRAMKDASEDAALDRRFE